jgi:hypothetical protein
MEGIDCTMIRNKTIKIIIVTFVIFICLNVIIRKPLKIKNDSKALLDKSNPRNANAIETNFSTNPDFPTSIEVNSYYKRTTNDANFYIEVELIKGEVYFLWGSWMSTELYLYDDPGFSVEIESTVGYVICFAPNETKNYYIRWYRSGAQNIGVFKAVHYNEDEVQEGIDLTFINDDWARTIIYFTMPNTLNCQDKFDIELTIPSHIRYWKQIDINSSNAFNYNEMTSDDLQEKMYENPAKGFICCFDTEGIFQITLPESIFSIEIDWNLVFNIIIIIVAILSIIAAIYLNSRYLRIGKRISASSKRRKKEKQIERERHEREKKKKMEEKELKKIQQKKLSKESYDKIKQMLKVSTRLKLDLMRNTLGMSKYVFNNLIFNWAEEFNLTIEGDEIIINKETVNDLINALDQKFKEWEEDEYLKTKKV